MPWWLQGWAKNQPVSVVVNAARALASAGHDGERARGDRLDRRHRRRLRPARRPPLPQQLTPDRRPPVHSAVVTAPPFDRAAALARLGDEAFDVLVVGGGITGAGVALDASSRAAHRARRARRLRVGHVVEVVEARARRAALPAAERGRPRLRGARRAPAPPPQRAAPRAGAAVPAPGVHAATACFNPKHRAGPRQRDVDVRPHRRAAHRQAAQAHHEGRGARAHADAAGRPRRRRPTSTTTPRPTTPGSRSRSRDDRGRLRRRRRELTPRSSASRKDADGRVDGAPWSRPTARTHRRAGRGRRERDRRVGRRRARARRGHAPDSIRPAKGIHITVPWAQGAQRHRGRDPGAEGPALGVRRAVATATVHLHRHHRHRLRRPARRSAVHAPTTSPTCSRAINASVTHRRSPSPTSSARGPACARSSRPRRASAPPTSRGATRCARPPSGVVTVTGGKLTTYRRMAADTVDEVVPSARHARRRSRTTHASACTAPTGCDARPDSRRRPPGRRATAATRARSMRSSPPTTRPRPSRSCPGSRTRRPRPCTPCAHEMARTRRRRARRAAPAPGCSPATRRPPPPPTWPTSWRAELGWPTAERDRQVDALPRARSTHERDGARLPETALDALAHRRVVSPSRAVQTRPRRADAADRARRRAARIARPARAPHRVEVDDALRAARATGADVTDDAVELGEASRDWWPLAMIWALDDRSAALGRRWSPGPRPRRRSPPCCASCNDAAMPVTAAGGRSGVCGASVPRLRRRAARPHRDWPASSTSTTRRCVVDVLPGTFGDVLRGRAARRARRSPCGHWPQSMALSTVGGWLACRGAGQFSTRYGKIEDMVVGPRRRARRRHASSPPAARPRAAVGPDLTQLFVGSRGHARRHHRRPAARSIRCPPPRRRAAYGFAIVRRRARRDAGASCGAARRRRCCGSTTRSRRDRSYQTGDAHVLLVLDEGDADLVDATMAIVDEECAAPPTRSTSALVEQWLRAPQRRLARSKR